MGYISDALDRIRSSSTRPEAGAGEAPPDREHAAPDGGAGPDTFRVDFAAKIARGGSDVVDDRLVNVSDPGGVLAEEYRSIRTGLLARWQHKRHLVHTITSATPQEGKTITSLNLGMSLAELHNRRVVVVEADLRLPQFRKLMGLPESQGVVGHLSGEAGLDEVIHTFGDTSLDVISAGKPAGNHVVQLLSSHAMEGMVRTLRSRYDHVIIDTPPVVELADAGILGAISDDVILIVRMNRTPRTLAEQAVRTLNSYNAPVAGMIATDHTRRHQRYYYHRYGYRYHYRYQKQAA